MGPRRLGGLGLLKQRRLHEESCLLNPTHWYAEVQVARAPNSAAFQTPTSPAPHSTHTYTQSYCHHTADQNGLQLIIHISFFLRSHHCASYWNFFILFYFAHQDVKHVNFQVGDNKAAQALHSVPPTCDKTEEIKCLNLGLGLLSRMRGITCQHWDILCCQVRRQKITLPYCDFELYDGKQTDCFCQRTKWPWTQLFSFQTFPPYI